MQTFEAGRFGRPLLAGGVALLVLGAVGTSVYTMNALTRERRHSEEVAASNQALNASLRQVQSELGLMSEKLNALSTPPPAPPPTSAPARVVQAAPRVRTANSRKTAKTTPADDHWNQVQARLADQQKNLAEQQKQIASTREEVDQTRQDLTGKLSSTRDELNGSIARNHDELATLQKRGERKYYEFQLTKSKEFQRVGPLNVSVRKVDFKHKYYDLYVMVDDRQIEKKHVNLYEPLMLTLDDHRQPVELVVNGIDKSQVKGYVSEPKYKESDLAKAAAPATDTQGLQRR